MAAQVNSIRHQVVGASQGHRGRAYAALHVLVQVFTKVLVQVLAKVVVQVLVGARVAYGSMKTGNKSLGECQNKI